MGEYDNWVADCDKCGKELFCNCSQPPSTKPMTKADDMVVFKQTLYVWWMGLEPTTRVLIRYGTPILLLILTGLSIALYIFDPALFKFLAFVGIVIACVFGVLAAVSILGD
jgi:hypothetical protein